MSTSSKHIVKEEKRGSGRTHRALDAVPDGAIYLLHSTAMKEHAKGILRKLGRREDAVKFIIVHDLHSLAMLRGLSAEVYCDHWLWDHAIPECKLELHNRLKAVRNYKGVVR